ncbi:outer membrane beta-barrel protein [Maribacter litoralis]|uniref:outer membrane beta-barrel protein n=1 Tax=Maribacter litoralis TaxID=2059726 RepID=UPI003F5CDEAA
MQKKNIDELFRDKLSDFKQTPDNKVWRAIDASLDKRKKKRVIPLWWSLGGVAAALLIGLLVFNPFTEEYKTNEILVDTDSESESVKDSQATSDNEIFIDSINNTTNAIVEQNTVNEDHGNDDSILPSHQKEANKITVSTRNDSKKNLETLLTEDAIAKNNKNSSEDSIQNQNGLIAENISTDGLVKNDSKNISTDNIDSNINTNNKNNTETAIASNPTTKDAENAIAESTSTEENTEDPLANKKSIFEEKEKQEELKKEKVAQNRWSAGPNVAPVYFNALGEGSPVNSIFTPNAKSGNVNMSYGVSVAYAVSKKLTIRSGINKVDYGYDTEDVAFSSSSSFASGNGQLATIDYAETSNTLTISSKIVPSDKYSTVNTAQDVTAKSASKEGFMSQQLGYLELPVELNYALIDKKFGVNIIGGVSSLFLIDNAVSLTSGDLTTEIGEANNINDLNFSANMGLGLNYNFSQKVRFNVEPIFKYQLNTFSDVNGTFRPYSVGVYSGLTFKF